MRKWKLRQEIFVLSFTCYSCDRERQASNCVSLVHWHQSIYKSVFMKVILEELVLLEQQELQKLQRCIDLET